MTRLHKFSRAFVLAECNYFYNHGQIVLENAQKHEITTVIRPE